MVTADKVIEGVTSRSKTLDAAWGWMTTVDHKRIGILYMVTAIIFFFGAGIEALVMRTQLARPDSTLVEAETFNQMFTMHALSMIFLGVMPMSVAFFNLIVPLAIGARDVAFPRLNALSYWIFLFGGLLLNGGFISGMGSPDAGWFAYANLTEEPFSKGQGMSFYALGLITLGVSSLAGAFNFLVTIINMRAPGMTLMRMPPFIWMTLVTSFLLVTAMPVITVGLIQILFDRNFGTNFFDTTAGGSPVLWQHVFWLFGHPEVYILILPAMGIVSEIIPTFSRKPLFGYHFVIFSGIVIGFMGWGVWSHHMFTVGLGNIANSVFAITTMLIAIPTGVKIFNWLGTMWGGSIRFSTPMLFRARIRGYVHTRRPEWRDPRLAPRRRPATGQLLHRRPPTLRAVRRQHHGPARRDLLLVPQGHWPDAQRQPGQASLLAGDVWVEPHLLPHAHPRPGGHAPQGVHLLRHVRL